MSPIVAIRTMPKAGSLEGMFGFSGNGDRHKLIVNPGTGLQLNGKDGHDQTAQRRRCLQEAGILSGLFFVRRVATGAIYLECGLADSWSS
jgi:hypothetical protein